MMELSDPSKSDNRDIIRRQNKAKLNYLFSDYPQLQESINKIDSDRDQWIALFQKYHDISETMLSMFALIMRKRRWLPVAF